MTFIVFAIAFIICYATPLSLTIWNIYNCLSEKPKNEKLISSLTMLIGGILYILFHLTFNMYGNWDKQIYFQQIHYSLSTEYLGILWIAAIGFIAYFVLLYVASWKIPPLLSAFLIAFLILLNIIQLAYAIQISKNVEWQFCVIYLYNFNILLLSARVVYKQMREQVEHLRDRIPKEGHNKFKWLYNKIDSITTFTIFVFIVLFFVVAVLEIIFVLAGQGLDAPIKAFTETADWTFSKQIPPPPKEYNGHYLCTVAAGGHSKVVKPLRLGTRGGETIVVNRQLCIANAFEEVIYEIAPRFHKIVRYAYDKYGYPISRHITTPLRADIIYFLMKPLELIFLAFIYLVDLRPEKRIARQYEYKEK